MWLKKIILRWLSSAASVWLAALASAAPAHAQKRAVLSVVFVLYVLFGSVWLAPLYSSYALSFDPFRVGIWGYALPRDSLTLIPRLSMLRLFQSRGGGQASLSSSGVLRPYLVSPSAAPLPSLFRVASPPLRYLRFAGSATLPSLRWLAPLASPQAAMPPSKKSLFNTLVGM